MSVHTSLPSPPRAADAGRGLIALLGVVTLVAGVPVVLVGWVGSPLPTEVPTVPEVAQAVRDTFIPDEFVVKALALACWLAWLELMASLLVEAVAYARGNKAGTVPLAGGLQRGAARLVAAVALLGAVVASRGEPGVPGRVDRPLRPVSLPVASLVADLADPGHDGGSRVTRAPGASLHNGLARTAALPTYEVQRRDTLWDIAERHLGDPLRWHEIVGLNEGRRQADGGCLVDPYQIRAGWRLQLPADAAGLPPVTESSGPNRPSPRGLGPAPAPSTPAVEASRPLPADTILVDHGEEGSPRQVDDDVFVVADSTIPPTRAATRGGEGDDAAAGRAGVVSTSARPGPDDRDD